MKCASYCNAGCFIKYDNATFLGIEDKTLLFKKCGSDSVYNSDALSSRDAVLSYLVVTDDGPYRYSSSSGIQAMGQCMQHIDKSKCQDCLTNAIGQLKTTCAASKSGDMFLGTCYVRYSEKGTNSDNIGSSSPSSHRPTTRWTETVFRNYLPITSSALLNLLI